MHRHAQISQATSKVLLIGGCLFTFQLVLSAMTRSISLFSDTAHVGGDLLAIFVVIGTQIVAGFSDRTRGSIVQDDKYHGIELAAVAANGLILLSVASILSLEATSRLSDPPNISGIILIPGLLGLAVNLWMLTLLWEEREHLTVQSALAHVSFDSLASIGVIVAGISIYATGERLIDPVVSFFIIFLIVIWGFGLIWRAARTYRFQNHSTT
ncbi:MAG: hypothetical protein A2Z11_01355 [Candidatus Woykebacteria bacterium RBG_16_43_9]|uniref:Cation efflux protein transmembrane domain-containing protein n=1 Tax=Candidatus Woykebacteria bacterium RBG_16_43_9 TaxID=1802596 RepID=A0A1G1WBT2_9BACT|nr:MAG: hypothetical protein A2Z11_01355 [Candidatus Woykebacteria bacterium RBG_16_43_9]